MLGAGRPAEAAAELQELVRRQPDCANARKELGDALLALDRPRDAIGQYTAALRLDDQCPSAHNNLGYALASNGSLPEAIAQYHTELKLCPASALTRLNLADALLRRGDVEAAVTQCESALRLEPDNVKAQSNLAWLLATAVPSQEVGVRRAVALAQQACQLTRYRQAACLDVLAAAYAAAGRFPEAVDAAQQGAALDAAAGGRGGGAPRGRSAFTLPARAGLPPRGPQAADASPLPGGIDVL